jgi:hypothetical protein
MSDNQIDTRIDRIARLQELKKQVGVLTTYSGADFWNKFSAMTQINHQIENGVTFDAMEVVADSLTAIDTIQAENAAAVAWDILADIPIPYRVVPGSGCAPVTGDDPDDNPPHEITECDDCGGAFFDLVGDGLCAACAMNKICDDCGCDVDWLNEDDLCQSCAGLSDDVSLCECGGLQVCYCDDLDDTDDS